MTNRYFIIDLPCDSKIWDVVLESENSARKSIDGTKAVIKLPLGCANTCQSLSGYKEFTHEEILQEMDKPEWTNFEI